MTLKVFLDFAVTPDILRLLRESTSGHQLIFPDKPVASVLHKAEWDPRMETADIVFGQPDPPHIVRAGRLKWIHVSSSSITRYDNPEFRALMAERHIAVSNSASVYNEACADHTLAFMLAQSRQLPLGLKTRAAGGSDVWRGLRGSCVPLRGQTVLIIGFGAIGKRLTELLRPYDMKVIACRRKPGGNEGVPVVTPDRLTGVLAQADHVINILPDSAETRGFFNTIRFAAMQPGTVFYNIGRGVTVDQDALLAALRSGVVKAAWLDVTEPEPLAGDHPLWAQANCYITPHVAGGHLGETKTLVCHFIKNFQQFIQGKPLFDRVM